MARPSSSGHPLVPHRKRKGLTQADLAEKLGITPGAVGQWEKRYSAPSRAHMAALIRILDVEDPRVVFTWWDGTEGKTDDTLRYLQTLSGQDARACLRRLGMLDPPSPIRAARRTPSRAD